MIDLSRLADKALRRRGFSRRAVAGARTLALALGMATLPVIAPAQQTVAPRVTSAAGAELRGLDKLTGTSRDISLSVGETVAYGGIEITLGDCRFPTENPAGDAYAWLVIREDDQDRPAFEGWMVASSPALNALEHPRYDVWVIRCTS